MTSRRASGSVRIVLAAVVAVFALSLAAVSFGAVREVTVNETASVKFGYDGAPAPMNPPANTRTIAFVAYDADGKSSNARSRVPSAILATKAGDDVGRLSGPLRGALRAKAGFKSTGEPIIVDPSIGANPQRVAAALRARGVNARFGKGGVRPRRHRRCGHPASCWTARRPGHSVGSWAGHWWWVRPARDSRPPEGEVGGRRCQALHGGPMSRLEEDRSRLRAIHERWRQHKNRDQSDADYPDEWYAEQCGACRHWLPLAGQFGNDYGACTNGASPFDKRVMFEHDGCEVFEPNGEWQ